MWGIGYDLVLVFHISEAGQCHLTVVTSTGDWPYTEHEVRYWRVDGGLCGAAEKEFSSLVECVGKAGFKTPAFLFCPCVDAKLELVP